MIIDPINNSSSFLQTIKDIITGINDHEITVLPEGEIGVLTPQKTMALDKMNTYAMLKKRPSSERERWSQPRIRRHSLSDWGSRKTSCSSLSAMSFR